MLEKRAWAMKRLDHLRKSIMLEPRGHTDMYGALLTEPVTRDGHAGILFMHNEGWSTMCGHGIIAVTHHRDRARADLVEAGRQARRPCSCATTRRPDGSRRAPHVTYRGDAVRVESVAFRNVPSFVFEPSLLVPVGGRKIPVDVAFGGAFYAIVDAEAAGVPIDAAHLPELRKLGMVIAREVEKLRQRRAPRRRRALKASTAPSSPRRRSCPTRTCATSRSSPTPKSIARRAAPAPPRSWPCSTTWACSWTTCPSSTRALSGRRSRAAWSSAWRWVSGRRSSPRLKARRGSPASTRS